jgi:hypothetical protein
VTFPESLDSGGAMTASPPRIRLDPVRPMMSRPLNAPQNVAVRFDWAEVAPFLQWDRNSTAAMDAHEP